MEPNFDMRPQHPMPILLTGAAGYLGSYLMDKLTAADLGVLAVYRHKIPASHSRVCPVPLDLKEKTGLESSLKGVHTLIHLAWERAENEAQADNVGILKNIVEAMESAQTPRILFVSAVGASRNSGDSFLKEKYLCEQLIINSKIKEKIILRSAVLFGGQKEAGLISAVKNLMKSPIFYPLPKSEGLISPLHVEDLSELITKCSLSKMYENCAILDLVGGDSYKSAQIFKIVAQKFNKNLLPLGSFLGTYMVKFLEKKAGPRQPRISDYLFIGSRIEKILGIKIRL